MRLRLLPDADSREHPALAFAAVAQLAALENNAARAAAITADCHLGDAGIWAAVEGALLQAGKQLWSLITRLAEIGEPGPAEGPTAAWKAVTTWADPPTVPAADSRESRQALAIQRAAIDALPEGELRRLLVLIGGMDPAALQRAAAIYTETFCAVAEMESSVAALRPVALACPVTTRRASGRRAARQPARWQASRELAGERLPVVRAPARIKVLPGAIRIARVVQDDLRLATGRRQLEPDH